MGYVLRNALGAIDGFLFGFLTISVIIALMRFRVEESLESRLFLLLGAIVYLLLIGRLWLKNSYVKVCFFSIQEKVAGCFRRL